MEIESLLTIPQVLEQSRGREAGPLGVHDRREGPHDREHGQRWRWEAEPDHGRRLHA